MPVRSKQGELLTQNVAPQGVQKAKPVYDMDSLIPPAQGLQVRVVCNQMGGPPDNGASQNCIVIGIGRDAPKYIGRFKRYQYPLCSQIAQEGSGLWYVNSTVEQLLDVFFTDVLRVQQIEFLVAPTADDFKGWAGRVLAQERSYNNVGVQNRPKSRLSHRRPPLPDRPQPCHRPQPECASLRHSPKRDVPALEAIAGVA